MALVDWNVEQKTQFLASQFDMQNRYYRQHYHNSRFDVIEQDGVAIGRLYVARWPAEMCVIDIALVPEIRGQGLGGRIMQALLDEAAAAGQRVSIHVEINNPAYRLYERLGFKPDGEETTFNQKMIWRSSRIP